MYVLKYSLSSTKEAFSAVIKYHLEVLICQSGSELSVLYVSNDWLDVKNNVCGI